MCIQFSDISCIHNTVPPPPLCRSKTFLSPQKGIPHPWSSPCFSLPPTGPGNHHSAFFLYRFIYSGYAYKCDHITCDLVCLVSIIQRIFGVHSCVACIRTVSLCLAESVVCLYHISFIHSSITYIFCHLLRSWILRSLKLSDWSHSVIFKGKSNL